MTRGGTYYRGTWGLDREDAYHRHITDHDWRRHDERPLEVRERRRPQRPPEYQSLAVRGSEVAPVSAPELARLVARDEADFAARLAQEAA